MNCPNQNLLRAYYDREVDAASRAELERHLANCSECRARVHEIEMAANRVRAQIGVLDELPASPDFDSQRALARFKAEHEGAPDRISLLARLFAHPSPAWAAAFAVILLALALAFPSGRSLAQRLLGTLRVERIQPVRMDFSAVDSNRTLQQMLGQMISDKMVVTLNEEAQHPSTLEAASQLAGFPVRQLTARTDAPQLTVVGQHAFHMTVDRERLQEIFDQSGRSDLLLPAKLDGATVSVQIPRSVHLQYGDCRQPKQAAAPSQPVNPLNCLMFIETPSPTVNVPPDLNIQQLAEIALQLGGMDATKAQQLCKSIDWRSTLVLPVPRFVDSYTAVEVNGAQGTLISHTDRRGSDYALIWVKDGIIYALMGHGDSSEGLKLADSLE
jgi:Putative zinc-finger